MGKNNTPVSKDMMVHFKELEKLLQEMRKGYSARDNFALLMEIMSITLANVVRTPQWEEREQQYLRLIKGVDVSTTTKAFAYIMEWFGKQAEPVDLLGPFHTWVGMDNSGSGQFFTPWSVAVMMSEISLGTEEAMKAVIAKKGYATINDPTCGASGMLVAAANVLQRKDIDYTKSAAFYGQELMPTTARTCFVQCALYGMPAVIGHGDTLRMTTIETFVTPAFWAMMKNNAELQKELVA